MTSDPAIAGESLTTLAARLPSSNPALANLSRPTQRRSHDQSSPKRRMTGLEGQCKMGWPDTYDLSMSKPKPTPKPYDKRRHFDAAFKLPSSQLAKQIGFR